MGDLYPDATPIVIYESVLERILDFSQTDLSRELGGFLVGLEATEPEPHVEIRRFLPALETKQELTSITFTHATWAAVTREVDVCFPNERVVGWHHTHPGFGVFLSSYDLFIHRHFFSAVWQVALVVDPRRQEFGFFQWRGTEIVDCGFVCVED
jgi:proteasome lid subunit RPN8/RPN11